jgi:hypothetical protein
VVSTPSRSKTHAATSAGNPSNRCVIAGTASQSTSRLVAWRSCPRLLSSWTVATRSSPRRRLRSVSSCAVRDCAAARRAACAASSAAHQRPAIASNANCLRCERFCATASVTRPGRPGVVARARQRERAGRHRVFALAETGDKAVATLRASQRVLLNASGSSRTLMRERRSADTFTLPVSAPRRRSNGAPTEGACGSKRSLQAHGRSSVDRTDRPRDRARARAGDLVATPRRREQLVGDEQARVVVADPVDAARRGQPEHGVRRVRHEQRQRVLAGDLGVEPLVLERARENDRHPVVHRRDGRVRRGGHDRAASRRPRSK